MRLFEILVIAGATLAEENCFERQIRLWIHIDLTASFTDWRAQAPSFLKTSLTQLVSKYPNLEFGMSGFGDRPNTPDGQMDDTCYVDGVDFEAKFDDAKMAGVAKLSGELRRSYFDLEEDPLTALPWIAKHKFGDYKDNELRIMVVATDYGPHYYPLYPPGYHTGSALPDQPPEDLVTCDPTKRWGSLDELMDPVKQRRIFPLFTIYSPTDPEKSSMGKWQTVIDELGYESNKLVNLGGDYDPDKFTNAIEQLIDENKCSPAPTNPPSNGTIPTDPATNSEDGGNKAVLIAGASAGIVALLAAGAGYRLRNASQPTLDIEEAEAAQEIPDDVARETAITMNEDAYE